MDFRHAYISSLYTNFKLGLTTLLKSNKLSIYMKQDKHPFLVDAHRKLHDSLKYINATKYVTKKSSFSKTKEYTEQLYNFFFGDDS